MKMIKIIMAAIGLVFIGMASLWVFGFLSSILWYVFWIGLLGAVGYGGYTLFLKAERKALGSDPHAGLGAADINMSWDEYDRKYLRK